MHQRSSLPGADEGEHAADQRIPRELLFDPLEPIAEDALPEEQGVIGAAQTVDVGPRKAAPAHPDHIKPVEHGALADGEAKRDDIGSHSADARDHGALADPYELVDGGGPAEDNPVAQRDVTTQNRVVGQDHVITDVTVVADMGADHEETAVADAGDATAVLGAGVHRHVLADIATGADLEPRGSAAILGRLRRRAERRVWIDLTAWPNRGVAGQVDMSDKDAALADADIRADHAIGADHRLRPDRRSAGDASGRIDRGHCARCSHCAHPITTMAPTSASATT